MKKALLFVLKTGLFVFFVYNLGAVSYILDTKKHPPAPLKENFKEEDLDWLNEKYENALKLGAQYSPELYFSDITEIQLKQKTNEFDRRSLLSVNSITSSLATIFHQNLLSLKSKSNGAETLSYMERVNLANEKYDEILNPGITKRRQQLSSEIETLNYWLNLLATLLLWILNQYLKNLIPAFLLLWLWWYQEQKSIKINNPLSFLLCLLLYPIVIIRTWAMRLNENARYLVMTIEYRRRNKNLFALFSDNELAEIKKLVKTKISLADYRLTLEQCGLTINHALVPALIVSLLLISLPAKTMSSPEVSSSLGLNQTELWQNAPPSVSINLSVDYNYVNFDSIIIEENISPFIIEKIITYLVDYAEKCLDGHPGRLKPIPLFIKD